MLHCLNTSGNLAGSCSDMTVLERQRARIKWQRQQEQQQEQEQEQGFFSTTGGFNAVFCSSSSTSSSSAAADCGSSLADVVAHSITPDPAAFQNGWPKPDKFVMGFASSAGLLPPPPPVPVPVPGGGYDVNSAISRTCSCPPSLAQAKATTDSGKMINSSFIAKESPPKKRKADRPNNSKVVAENDNKRIKVGADDGESKITAQTRTKNNAETNCSDTSSKENPKVSDQVQKPDYIHVRARRGQATDSHSLAERVRREKISERMKYLQDLVPGCNKITGKAGMLDEIINYVQSLQRQVEFLSMKLAAVNPRLDFNIDELFAKEVFPACATSFPTIGMSSSSADMANPAYLHHFNSQQQQIVSGCGLDAGINPPDMGLRRTISAPVSTPETFVDSSCFTTQILPSSAWEGDIQNLYNVAFDQARAPSFASQLFTGLVEPSNPKMEM